MKKKILVVEDEESLLRLESILLSSKGFNVVGVKDGISALAAIPAENPDLVILDIMLPEMDGIEVCRRIKADPATAAIPVVMLTAKKSRQDIDAGTEAGASAYITKPFKTAMVIEVIEGLLGK
jgi:DNA-binding response OmpR family regulator